MNSCLLCHHHHSISDQAIHTRKYIGYKNVLITFLQTRKLMSGECGLPGQKLSDDGDREGRNSLLLPLLVAGAYDPSSIWFQYFLCKDQQIYCYFFTQGWNQYEYGQYFLYENLLDDTTGIFAVSTDSNLATLALLGGLGGGSHHGGYYPSPSGYSQVPSGQGRRRRESEEKLCEDDDANCNRKRRSECDPNTDANCKDRRRRSSEAECNPNTDPNCKDRKRRSSVPVCDPDTDPNCRKRRSSVPVCDPNTDPNCKDRKRRSSVPVCDPNTDLNCKDR